MTRGPNDFVNVTATPEEIEEYKAKHKGFPPAVYRARCKRCGTRLWKSGLGVGSHRRVCTGPAFVS